MTYSTGEVARKLHVSKDTLRYYEKEGLLPRIQRDTFGHRVYSEADIDWIFLVRCLRDTAMPIAKIKCYVALLKHGGRAAILERRTILSEHQTLLAEKILSYQSLLSLIDKKISFYDKALNPQKADTVKCLDYATEWEDFRGSLGVTKNE